MERKNCTQRIFQISRGRGLCNADPAHRGREEKEEHKGTLDDGSRDARLVKRLGAQAAAGLGLGRSPAWSRLGGWSGSVHPRDRIQWLTGTRKVVCWCRLRDRVCIGLESPLCCGRPGGRSRQACRTRNAHRARCGAQGWATLSPGTCSQRGVALWRALSFVHWQAGAGSVPGCSGRGLGMAEQGVCEGVSPATRESTMWMGQEPGREGWSQSPVGERGSGRDIGRDEWGKPWLRDSLGEQEGESE